MSSRRAWLVKAGGDASGIPPRLRREFSRIAWVREPASVGSTFGAGAAGVGVVGETTGCSTGTNRGIASRRLRNSAMRLNSARVSLTVFAPGGTGFHPHFPSETELAGLDCRSDPTDLTPLNAGSRAGSHVQSGQAR